MSAEYRWAPEVEAIAKRLIEQVPEHQDLDGVRIVYLFRKKAQSSRGRTVLGSARRISGLPGWLSHPAQRRSEFAEPLDYFLVEIAHDTWLTLDDHQRVALVDHELSHCAVVDDPKADEIRLVIRHHDVEEFRGVIKRNGLWKSDVQDMGVIAAEQLQLALERIGQQSAGIDVDTLAAGMAEHVADVDGLDSVTITSGTTGKSVTITRDGVE